MLRSAWPFAAAAFTVLLWWLGTRSNPALIPTWLVLALLWSWLWIWWRIQHVVPRLSGGAFGPSVIAVVLVALSGVYSLGFAAMRDHAYLRSPSADGSLVIVVTGRLNDAAYDISRERAAGLLLEQLAHVRLPGEPVPGFGSHREPPDVIDWHWSHERLAALLGDGRYLALFERDGDELREMRPYRDDHEGILRLLDERSERP